MSPTLVVSLLAGSLPSVEVLSGSLVYSSSAATCQTQAVPSIQARAGVHSMDSLVYPTAVRAGETFTVSGRTSGFCHDDCPSCSKQIFLGFATDSGCPGSTGSCCSSQYSSLPIVWHQIRCAGGRACDLQPFTVSFVAPTTPGCYGLIFDGSWNYCSYTCADDSQDSNGPFSFTNIVVGAAGQSLPPSPSPPPPIISSSSSSSSPFNVSLYIPIVFVFIAVAIVHRVRRAARLRNMSASAFVVRSISRRPQPMQPPPMPMNPPVVQAMAVAQPQGLTLSRPVVQATAVAQPQGLTLSDELGRLQGLHNAGALSQAEFEAAKARILDLPTTVNTVTTTTTVATAQPIGMPTAQPQGMFGMLGMLGSGHQQVHQAQPVHEPMAQPVAMDFKL